MTDIGYDGTLDVPDDPLPQYARCLRCEAPLRPEDDADCGKAGCPVTVNRETIEELRRA